MHAVPRPTSTGQIAPKPTRIPLVSINLFYGKKTEALLPPRQTCGDDVVQAMR